MKRVNADSGEFDYILPYGVITSIEHTNRYSTSHGFRDFDSIDVDIKFKDVSTYRHFVHDLRKVQVLQDEAVLREKFPALKNAWNEYQLLLKLTK